MVDDDPITLEVNLTAMASMGVTNVLALEDSREILPLLENRAVSAIILDLKMPHMPGTTLLPILTRKYPQIPVIVMTSSNDLETAVSCMKAGAADYLTKPANAERIIASIEKAMQIGRGENDEMGAKDYLLNDNLDHPDAFDAIITNSKKMRSLFKYVEAVAHSDQPVLLSGETGVGKELFAKAVARLSNRNGPFVTVNAAGLDDALFSDTLFGHNKGAYTGADQTRDGLVSAAASGSLFLDEIGDLTESSQIKLLRLIQEQEFYPTGSDQLKKCDARIIVATNHDLAALISDGKFRKDLYYRLCAHRIHVPPLRERREDIPCLLEHFAEVAATALNKPRPVVSREVVALLSTYHFEGNVRELHGMVFDAVARHFSGPLTLDHFVGISRKPILLHDVEPLGATNELDKALFSYFGRFPTIREVEDYLIASAMNLTSGHQRSAASLLGIARQTLSKRLNGSGDLDSDFSGAPELENISKDQFEMISNLYPESKKDNTSKKIGIL